MLEVMPLKISQVKKRQLKLDTELDSPHKPKKSQHIDMALVVLHTVVMVANQKMTK